jgi:hypothetical protein
MMAGGGLRRDSGYSHSCVDSLMGRRNRVGAQVGTEKWYWSGIDQGSLKRGCPRDARPEPQQSVRKARVLLLHLVFW